MKAMTFSWNAVTTDSLGGTIPQPPMYKLYTRLVNGAYVESADTSELSVSVAMPTAGSYQAIVKAYSPDGEGAQSNMATFNSVPQVPAAPTGLTVT